jgi:hypothetical protein
MGWLAMMPSSSCEGINERYTVLALSLVYCLKGELLKQVKVTNILSVAVKRDRTNLSARNVPARLRESHLFGL